jgi:hypothetical protein
MRSDTEGSAAMHFFGTYLHLNNAAISREHSRVQTLIAVGLGEGDIIFDLAGSHDVPKDVQDQIGAKRQLKKGVDLLHPTTIEDYFTHFYSRHSSQLDSKCIVSGGNGGAGLAGRFEFTQIGEAAKLISEDTVSILVRYGNNEQQLQQLIDNPDNRDLRRDLQTSTIAVTVGEWIGLHKGNHIDSYGDVGDEFYVLKPHCYDLAIGLTGAK